MTVEGMIDEHLLGCDGDGEVVALQKQAILEIVAVAVAEEREACARLAWNRIDAYCGDGNRLACVEIATAIRARRTP